MAADSTLTNARIFRFYLPLALSWLFMSIESPVSISIISRMEMPKVHTAAFLMLMSLSLWIESPVIDLLSTSTTLCRDQERYRRLRTFAFGMMGWCTMAHAIVALTPVYSVVTKSILHLPKQVVAALQIPMAIMIPWSALIGWRRFRQGILIRSGMTRAVGLGTAIRMSTMAVVGFSLYRYGGFGGTETAAISLVCSVLSEAIFVHVASMRVVRELPSEVAGPAVTMRSIRKFHLPLTATTMLTLTTGPIIGAALAQAPDAVLAMAAWQVTSTLVWMHRTIVFALPEAVITLYTGPETVAKLRNFCAYVGIFSSTVLFLLWLTKLDLAMFMGLLGTDADTARFAHVAVGLSALLPILNALQSFAKGTLSVHHRTMPRLLAMGVGMVALLLGLVLGVKSGVSGVVYAALAGTFALLAELVVLSTANSRALRLHTDTLV